MLNIVLFSPEIPGNTGSVGRTCVALDLKLILIHPLGFDIDEKAVRRAGLDYWKHVNLIEYKSWNEFLLTENPDNDSLFFFSKGGKKVIFEGKFNENSYLIFGSETKGLPEEILESFKDRTFHLPQNDGPIRSLNLSNVATAAAYEALRQIRYS